MQYERQVYLAGPMTAGESWRDHAHIELQKMELKVVKPEFLEKYVQSFKVTEGEAARILTQRDRKFASGSEYVLANFDGATARSMGTCIELGWADNDWTTTVAVLPPDNPHMHPIVLSVCDYVVDTLDEALNIIEALAWRNA